MKIDVEGYEAEVLGGLAEPVAALSFEYRPPRRQVALDCIERLEMHSAATATTGRLGESHALGGDRMARREPRCGGARTAMPREAPLR